ncbi:tetraspanin-1-like [Takifugu flavidus]|uniref:tetraspanin-1-like n=1 Tax=Takifugu flavidus TaxID=433684 RepID=UPI00254475CF|nr:tetraspanin-1-like [Takifugu flavidus]
MCCSGFLKVMMFIFNGGIFLAGAAILAVGVWVKVDSGSFLGILDDVEGVPVGLSQLVNISYLLIALGAVLLVIGFLGCCGAIKESRCMLLTFFIIILIIFIAEVAGAIVLFVFTGVAAELFAEVENAVRDSIKKSYGTQDSLTILWNTTMEQFGCCGVKNYTDFKDSPFQGGRDIYPQFCCNISSTTFPCNANQAMSSMVDGCLDKLVAAIEENSLIIAGVAIGITAIEIAAMVVSMVLYKQIGTKA